MVKEFKQFDKMYAHMKGRQMPYEVDSADVWKEFMAHDRKSWHFELGKYNNAEIRHAVYFSASAHEWQKFRVSLKGNTTVEKLNRLMFRRVIMMGIREEHIRIDNYIGALVRGGQLNTNLEVIR